TSRSICNPSENVGFRITSERNARIQHHCNITRRSVSLVARYDRRVAVPRISNEVLLAAIGIRAISPLTVAQLRAQCGLRAICTHHAVSGTKIEKISVAKTPSALDVMASPNDDVASRCAPDFRTMLTTPAIASDPYWA